MLVLTDPEVEWGKRCGLDVRCDDGLGLRHKRFAAVVDKGVYTYMQVSIFLFCLSFVNEKINQK